MLAILDTAATGLQNVRSRISRVGVVRTIASALATAISPVVRRRERLIWEVELGPQHPSRWDAGERLLILGPENIDRELTPELLSFLGKDSATELGGVRSGDLLFVVAAGTDFLACSYIFFDTTRETRRHSRLYCEPRNTPIIGMSFTSPSARGRGLYRRILNDMFVYLAHKGCRRAICEVHPTNAPSNRASQAAGMRVCRELCDWSILKRIFIQQVTEGGKSRWRVLWA